MGGSGSKQTPITRIDDSHQSENEPTEVGSSAPSETVTEHPKERKTSIISATSVESSESLSGTSNTNSTGNLTRQPKATSRKISKASEELLDNCLDELSQEIDANLQTPKKSATMLSTQSHNSSRQLSNLSQRELEDVILKESRQTVRSQPETGYESPRIVLDRNPDEWQVKEVEIEGFNLNKFRAVNQILEGMNIYRAKNQHMFPFRAVVLVFYFKGRKSCATPESTRSPSESLTYQYDKDEEDLLTDIESSY